MIAALLNLLFGCRHRRISRPMTAAHRPGMPAAATYVVCLECGQQFHYDLSRMRIGKPMPMAATSSGAPGFQTQYN